MSGVTGPVSSFVCDSFDDNNYSNNNTNTTANAAVVGANAIDTMLNVNSSPKVYASTEFNDTETGSCAAESGGQSDTATTTTSVPSSLSSSSASQCCHLAHSPSHSMSDLDHSQHSIDDAVGNNNSCHPHHNSLRVSSPTRCASPCQTASSPSNIVTASLPSSSSVTKFDVNCAVSRNNPTSALVNLPPPSEKCVDEFGAKVEANESACVSWVSPKLEARRGSTGCGIFCVSPIEEGEELIVWSGKVVDTNTALKIMETDFKHYILQVGDGFYQIPIFNEREPADFTNHSCHPNAGFGKQSSIILSARLPIRLGDEITFDYAMCETDERLWEPMECQCGAAECRGLITANDWKRPDLWERYHGFWAPHVHRLVDNLRAQTNNTMMRQLDLLDDASNDESSSVCSSPLLPNKPKKKKKQVRKMKACVVGSDGSLVDSTSSSSSSSDDVSGDDEHSPINKTTNLLCATATPSPNADAELDTANKMIIENSMIVCKAVPTSAPYATANANVVSLSSPCHAVHTETGPVCVTATTCSAVIEGGKKQQQPLFQLRWFDRFLFNYLGVVRVNALPSTPNA